MTASPLSPTDTRARCGVRRLALRWLAIVAVLQALVPGGRAFAEEPVKGEVKVYTDGGFARLAFRFEKEVPASIQVSFPILVVTFKKPVAIALDRLSAGAADYISAARLDPDGTAIRIALTRKLKFNSIAAAERLYVDLLPPTWSGLMPGLPPEVIEELANRALAAERQLRQQKISDKKRGPSTIRVKVATQPTFTRYVFALPDAANVVPENSDGKLTLEFDQPIKWDLADAKAAMPPTLTSIDTDVDHDSVAVTFVLKGSPQVRTFREDRSIVVDIGRTAGKPESKPRPAAQEGAAQPVTPPQAAAAPVAAPAIAAPETVPARDAAAAPSAAPSALPAVPTAPPPAKVAEAPPVVPGPPGAAEPKQAAEPVRRPAPNPDAPVVVELHQAGGALRIEFPFAVATPAAIFQRADTLFLVFDSASKIDLSAFSADTGNAVRNAELERGKDGEAIVRIRLEQPRLTSLEQDGAGWIVTVGDTVKAPSRPLLIARNIAGNNRASIDIPFENPRQIHHLVDRDLGARLLVVTALGPARGLLKEQDFVELRALPTTHGVVLQPLADDVTAELTADKIVIGRPGGLSLSSTAVGQQQLPGSLRALSFDTQLWGANREAKFNARQSELMRLAAMAPAGKRRQARFDLARFYLARDMSAEAKAVLTIALADKGGAEDVTGIVLKAAADVMLERPDDALKELSNPLVGNQLDSQIWRGIALARQSKWTEAYAAFKDAGNAISALPIELQRMTLRTALRTAIEVRDFSGADRFVNALDVLGVPPEKEPALAVLVGRLNEALGRPEDALASYRTAATSPDRRAAAQGRLREIALHLKSGETPVRKAIDELETLTTIWRGDETETEGLKLLAHLYTVDKRYGAAFHTMRTAVLAHPNSDFTRQIQDEAATTFDSLFLGGKGDALPPIEALGMFYDYRDLIPIGRRGDEMIRRLADRLVAVDLLDQAAELLQHQVDHRLQGAARAQVATRLAVIYLTNRKPDRALATLRATRTAELSNELRDQRLLLEARALSDIGRRDLALELIANIDSREAIRLRSDILWAAQRWRAASEQIEVLYGDRWRQFTPLNETERFDILRGAIGYSLGEEPMGLARFREKYAAKMAGTPDARAFDVVSSPIGSDAAEFQDIARKIANADSLGAFLRDLRKRYPEQPPAAPAAANKPGPPAAAAPAQQGPQSKAATPDKTSAAEPSRPAAPAPQEPAATQRKSDASPTGSIVRSPAMRTGMR